jgi:CheY-like chemotaxis protein/HPt (histidine-containing phosphotransfer) domain-containing protein
LRFSVSDTGAGIPKDKLQAIFEAFTQADSSTTRRYGGTGLGLAISSELVRLMGGKIRAESEIGAGSKFEFTLRLKLSTAMVQSPAVSDTQFLLPEATRGLRILVAEDNPINEVLVTDLLKEFGHETVVVHNGREAIAAFERERWDVVLMDVQMPEMDGLAATTLIRQIEEVHENRGRTPVIALTAHAMSGDRERCLAAGMDDYLSKPIQWRELLRAIDQFTKRGDGARAAVSDAGFEHAPVASATHGGSAFGVDSFVQRCRGNQELARQIAGIFAEQTPRLLNAIREAIGRGDANGVERAAHTLKGSLGQVGAGSAARLAIELENAGRAGDLSGTERTVIFLEEEIIKLDEVMDDVLERAA